MGDNDAHYEGSHKEPDALQTKLDGLLNSEDKYHIFVLHRGNE